MEKHDLHHEFPQYDEAISSLKKNDNHFRKLYDEYIDINKDIIVSKRVKHILIMN